MNCTILRGKKDKKTNEGIIRKGANTNKTKGPLRGATQVENVVKTLHLYWRYANQLFTNPSYYVELLSSYLQRDLPSVLHLHYHELGKENFWQILEE